MSSEKIMPSDFATKESSTSEDTISSQSTNSTELCEKNEEDCVLENFLDATICSTRNSEASAQKNICCNTPGQCVWAIILIVLSVTGFVYKPLDFLLWEKLHMRPGFPPYEWWSDPPDEVKLRVYVFNVTNHERFLLGYDEKLNVEEIGPIVYLEKLLHSNMRFNENSTLTYTAKRFPIFLPKENHLDLNSTLIVPNLVVLGLASYLHNSNYFVRTGFKFLADSYGSELFLKKTLYEFLWDYKDPVLDTSKSLAPGLVPVNNMGMLARIYSDFTDNVTVFLGPRWGHNKFFQINRFQGNPQLPGYDPNDCPDRILGATEGVMYRQHLTKQDILLYWRKSVCKLMPLYFDSELTLSGVPLYRYNLSETAHDRISNSTDCYNTQPALPDGVSDGSKCYYDFPMVCSFPHFYANEKLKDRYITGLKPDRTKHNSYIIVEPLTGTPFHSVARMQSNLRVHDLSGFSSRYHKLSNLILPLFWAEYNQEDLPLKIKWTILFTVVILPPLTISIQVLSLISGLYLITRNIYDSDLCSDKLKKILLFKSKGGNRLAKNSMFTYEREEVLKNPT